MRATGGASVWLALLVVLVASAGCGGRRPRPPAEPKQLPLSRAPATELSESVVRVADPEGKWRFEAHSATMRAAGVEGPFTLIPARCRYQEPGRDPVEMEAERAHVDKQARHVSLRGSVVIVYQEWRLEAERVECDLKTGKVVVPGRQKLILGPGVPRTSRRAGSEAKP